MKRAEIMYSKGATYRCEDDLRHGVYYDSAQMSCSKLMPNLSFSANSQGFVTADSTYGVRSARSASRSNASTDPSSGSTYTTPRREPRVDAITSS